MDRLSNDRESLLKPFTRTEWIVTVVLTLMCLGIPIGMLIQFHIEMARMEAAALCEPALSSSR